MNKSPFSFDFCRKVRLDKDARYDGLLFSGSSKTKIYCRPVCPGRPPVAANNVYFSTRAQAETAGYRPCLRCRPELAPSRQTEDIAGQHQKTCRLGFAKTLLTDTALPPGEISSICRFESSKAMLNELFSMYRRDPLSFRKPLPVANHKGLRSCALMLSYRPPFNWPVLLNFFRKRSVAGMEIVTDALYQRSFFCKGCRGWLSLQNMAKLNRIRLEIHSTNLSHLMELVWRVRRMLDLDANPINLESCFGNDSLLAPILEKYPGIRIPVAWDVYEYSIRAIVGQLISVQAATKLVTNIVKTFGGDLCLPAPEGIYKIFPTPEELVSADVSPCGLTKNKQAAVKNLTKAVLDTTLELENNVDLDLFIKQCTALRGIGEWTAQTIAMKGLGYKDAFPATDLGIIKALNSDSQHLQPAQIRAISESWRPWRAYAAMLLWSSSYK